ncbi:MAG: hypothetical protein D6729_19225 [Deltaproteobacteria bacterium]|nr:MAG: hypothetical protein D6729_19225 [Deltaproteobacteria bacterium]
MELGFEHPFDLGASAVALGEGHFYLFRGNVAGARILEESLVWLPLRQVCQPAVAGVTLPARPAEAGPATSVPVRLVPARRRSGRPEALLVPPSQTEALRRLLYLLPTAVLERHRALSLRRGVLLVGEGQVEAIPLGVPLRRYGEAVYLPLGWTLLPALPPALVAEAVGATPGRLYVFPGPEEPPFFVEEAQLEPLSRAFLGRLEAVAVAAAPLPPEPGRARLVYEKLGPFPLWGEGFHPLPTGGEER